MLAKPQSKEQAEKIIDHVSTVFMIIGAILLFLSLSSDTFIFQFKVVTSVQGAIYLVLGFLLKKIKKPIIPMMLLVISVGVILINFLNLFGMVGTTQHSAIPFMGVAVAIASVQALNATRKYNELK